MTPVQTIEMLRSEGFVPDIRDGRLVVRGHGKPSSVVQVALREHRQRILEILLVPAQQDDTSVQPWRTCLGTGPCPDANWTRRTWGGLVCETCHPSPEPLDGRWKRDHAP